MCVIELWSVCGGGVECGWWRCGVWVFVIVKLFVSSRSGASEWQEI